jgi:hypothetical protein
VPYSRRQRRIESSVSRATKGSGAETPKKAERRLGPFLAEEKRIKCGVSELGLIFSQFVKLICQGTSWSEATAALRIRMDLNNAQTGPFRRAISAAISLARDYVSYQNGNERCGALPIVIVCARSLLVSFVFHTAFVLLSSSPPPV